jgi:hypothetical protein
MNNNKRENSFFIFIFKIIVKSLEKQNIMLISFFIIYVFNTILSLSLFLMLQSTYDQWLAFIEKKKKCAIFDSSSYFVLKVYLESIE